MKTTKQLFKKAKIEDVVKFIYEDPGGGKEIHAYVTLSIGEVKLMALTFIKSFDNFIALDRIFNELDAYEPCEFKEGEKRNVEIELRDPEIKKMNNRSREIKLIDEDECEYKIKGKIIAGFVDHADFGEGIESLESIIVDCGIPVEVKLERDIYNEEGDFYLPGPAYPGAVTEFKRSDYSKGSEYVPDEDIIAKYADLHIGEYVEADGILWVDNAGDLSDKAYFAMCGSKEICDELIENYNGKLIKCNDPEKYDICITSPLTYREIIDLARRTNACYVHAFKKGRCIHDVSRGCEY